jgi:hypothetical protein
MSSGIHAVTDAFEYSGKCIAARLLKEGREVVALTNSCVRKNPFGAKVRAFPFNFDDPAALARSSAEATAKSPNASPPQLSTSGTSRQLVYPPVRRGVMALGSSVLAATPCPITPASSVG